MPIRHYIYDAAVFEPEAIEAMSKALEESCKALHIDGRPREVIATRIIDLARNGVADAKALSERVIVETRARRLLAL